MSMPTLDVAIIFYSFWIGLHQHAEKPLFKIWTLNELFCKLAAVACWISDQSLNVDCGETTNRLCFIHVKWKDFEKDINRDEANLCVGGFGALDQHVKPWRNSLGLLVDILKVDDFEHDIVILHKCIKLQLLRIFILIISINKSIAHFHIE